MFDAAVTGHGAKSLTSAGSHPQGCENGMAKCRTVWSLSMISGDTISSFQSGGRHQGRDD